MKSRKDQYRYVWHFEMDVRGRGTPECEGSDRTLLLERL